MNSAHSPCPVVHVSRSHLHFTWRGKSVATSVPFCRWVNKGTGHRNLLRVSYSPFVSAQLMHTCPHCCALLPFISPPPGCAFLKAGATWGCSPHYGVVLGTQQTLIPNGEANDTICLTLVPGLAGSRHRTCVSASRSSSLCFASSQPTWMGQWGPHKHEASPS